jgi:hypothetical protein
MRGEGRIFRRGRIWWIAYSRNGQEYRESSRGKDEKAARKTLQKRLAPPTGDSITIRDLVRGPDLVQMLPIGDVQALYSDCPAALDRLRARPSKPENGDSLPDGDTVVTQNDDGDPTDRVSS